MDNEDLERATNEFRNSCKELNNLMNKELEAFKALKQKESDVRTKHFKDVASGEMTQSKFKFYLENETFQERVDLETSKTERRIKENQKDSLRERLYTIKKKISIQ